MEEFKTLKDKLEEQQFRLRRMLGNTAAPGPVIDQTKNILYNNFDAIVQAVTYAVKAEEEIAILEQELRDAESDIDERDQTIKNLKAAKATGKKKATSEETDG